LMTNGFKDELMVISYSPKYSFGFRRISGHTIPFPEGTCLRVTRTG
jgi:hypothetical protein